MKELEQISMNFGGAIVGDTDGRMVPQAEVVIIHSEPTYRPGPGCDVVKARHVGEWRLMMGPAKMRQVAQVMMRSADDLEREFVDAVARLVEASRTAQAPDEAGAGDTPGPEAPAP